MKIGILEPDFFSIKGVNILKKYGQVLSYNSENDLDEFLSQLDVIFIRLQYKIDKDFLAKCKNLKILCSPTTGLNHIDIEEIERFNIKLISLREHTNKLKNVRATPEHTFGLVIALIRGYHKSFLSNINNDWNRYLYYGDEIFNSNIGIIGYGRVGRQLAKYFECFSANVHVYDINKIVTTKRIISCRNIDELINKSEIVILTASYKNKIILKKDQIDLLKDKYLINTSRGELIDENYLIEKIKNFHFKGVAVDVISNENSNSNNLKVFLKLTKNQNLIITPHISGVTINSLNKTEEIIINLLLKIL